MIDRCDIRDKSSESYQKTVSFASDLVHNMLPKMDSYSVSVDQQNAILLLLAKLEAIDLYGKYTAGLHHYHDSIFPLANRFGWGLLQESVLAHLQQKSQDYKIEFIAKAAGYTNPNQILPKKLVDSQTLELCKHIDYSQ